MEETAKKETILHFIYIRNENAKLNEFVDCIRLEKAKIKTDFNSSNDILFDFQLEENNIYYDEIIDIIFKKEFNNQHISFEYPIYKNKINNIYLDINENMEEVKLISLEIIYQTTKNELLPNHILYDDKKITLFDSYNNKLRKRVGLFNINPEKLCFYKDINKRYPDFKFENDKSYKIFIYLSSEEITEYSIDSSELNNHNLYQYQDLKSKLDKKASFNLLCKFKKEYYEKLVEDPIEYKVDEIINKINELKAEYNNIIKEKDYYENIKNYNNFEDIDFDIFSSLFYYFEFLELVKIVDGNKKDKIVQLNGKLFDLKAFNNDYEKYILEVKNLNINILDKLIIIKAYNKKFIDSFKSGCAIYYISTLVIENLSEINSYKQAINFIQEIISNLKEESRLFEVFLYLDSDTINNLLITNKKEKVQFIDYLGDKNEINYENNPTEYGINMSNLEEIKNHLFKLLPKFIIRIDTQMKFIADYDRNSKIMSLNEKALFNQTPLALTKLFEAKHVCEIYILPILIEILHEIYGHGKKRLIDNKSSSPEAYRDSKKNYKRMSVKKNINNLGKKIYPESGVVLEYFISENRNILRWLKMIHENDVVKKLLDVSLWVDKDFSRLEKIIQDNIKSDNDSKNENESKYETYIHPNDEDYLDSDDDTCGFHKYE